MENGIHSYLHKKFKKQLSVVESKSANEQRNNNDAAATKAIQSSFGIVEAKSEEKTWDNQLIKTRKDNIISVPTTTTKQSTNDQKFNNNVKIITNDKSSVISSPSSISSTATVTIAASSTTSTSTGSSSFSCISLVVGSNNDNNDEKQQRPLLISSTNNSFDTRIQEPSHTITTTSSILLDSVYNNNNSALIVKSNQDLGLSAEDEPSSVNAMVDKNSSASGGGGGVGGSVGGKHVCPYCNLVCSKPSVLQKHIRAHTNERPYPCDSCGFSFKTRSNLYKHCRSRTHANRVMGNKAQEVNELIMEQQPSQSPPGHMNDDEFIREKLPINQKPYKPRFHTTTTTTAKENDDDGRNSSEFLAYHINEIISKNNSIVNSGDSISLKKRPDDNDAMRHSSDEPLNLTNKNRKRCVSEIVEPVGQKSLIKELLLKNLNSDMQCLHCKMIFQTVTELELHKLRSCKGFVKPGAKYSRSSSVNVASILTHNKNAFDNIPHLQNSTFPLKSPGPFLGKTRLVDSDKNKSFSFDDGLSTTLFASAGPNNDGYVLSPLTINHRNDHINKGVKLFGGEVQITHTSGETKSFKIDSSKDEKYPSPGYEFGSKLSENRVVKSGLQSGGTILTNKPSYPQKNDMGHSPDVIRVYENTPATSTIDLTSLKSKRFSFDERDCEKYTKNMEDFSQKAVKSLVPNLKQPNLAVPGIPAPNHRFVSVISSSSEENKEKFYQKSSNFANPMNLYVNGKVVRYVPGIPGPVVTEEPADKKQVPVTATTATTTIAVNCDRSVYLTPEKPSLMASPKSPVETKSPRLPAETKKFARPNSLALKPTTACLKQHHGLTPTMFNQILISPDTPRIAKKYVQQVLHGNYFSYLGLKCTTRPVYCTLNKTQPFYVPHYKKLSMYSEWRQQDTKTDRLYVSAYNSGQKHPRYTTAGKCCADLIVHSSYKFVASECLKGNKGEDLQKSNAILGGYECNEDYTYIRGRGRGRYVCDQCGIRCKKPSMLKKHIRTHSNDRPYTCSHCNFSFKTKGNLTKHMKSKAHTKNYAVTGSSSSSTQQSGTQSSDSDTDDSGMDSSDESTRREEHEAAYGLLSLSQKTTTHVTSDDLRATTSRREAVLSSSHQNSAMTSECNNVMDTDETAYVSKTIYVKNKILDDKMTSAYVTFRDLGDNDATLPDETTKEARNLLTFLGRTGTNRPLTYPYTSPSSPSDGTNRAKIPDGSTDTKMEPTPITQFDVIQRYAPLTRNLGDGGDVVKSPLVAVKVPLPVLKVNDAVVVGDHTPYNQDLRKRKLHHQPHSEGFGKVAKNDEVMDLSKPPPVSELRLNGSPQAQPVTLTREEVKHLNNEVYRAIKEKKDFHPAPPPHFNNKFGGYRGNNNVIAPVEEVVAKNNGHNTLPPLQEEHPNRCTSSSVKAMKTIKPMDTVIVAYDNSAMETLADIATKQEKLEKNTLARSVASEYVKLATKNEVGNDGVREHGGYHHHGNEVNELVRSEGSKRCSVCAKSFSKPSQLRLHMNIHYLERPFRCNSCSISFRSKGHLQKHERSASHHNKLSSSPAQSSSEPRPFKCVDCNIAFRIHGHLAKHLRSKMHIMKLECLSKIPFGLYAELERLNSLTIINTDDGDQCLESLKALAKKIFIGDINKLNRIETDS